MVPQSLAVITHCWERVGASRGLFPVNSRTGPDDQGWGQPCPQGGPQSSAQLVTPPRSKTSELTFRCRMHTPNTECHRSPPGGTLPTAETDPRPLSSCRQAPKVAPPCRLGSCILSLPPLYMSQIFFNSLTHSSKASTSCCLLKPRHTRHRAGHRTGGVAAAVHSDTAPHTPCDVHSCGSSKLRFQRRRLPFPENPHPVNAVSIPKAFWCPDLEVI